MKRGDVYLVDFDPVEGHEQAGKRFALIVSRRPFNNMSLQFVCPITQGGNFARQRGYAVPISGFGTRTQGVVLCNHARVMDINARGGKFIEKMPAAIVEEVLQRLQTLID